MLLKARKVQETLFYYILNLYIKKTHIPTIN